MLPGKQRPVEMGQKCVGRDSWRGRARHEFGFYPASARFRFSSIFSRKPIVVSHF